MPTTTSHRARVRGHWACGVGRRADGTAHASCGAPQARLPQFDAHSLSLTAWAFAAADHAAPALFGGDAFVRRCEEAAAHFNDASLRQLHQWQLWREERCGGGGGGGGAPGGGAPGAEAAAAALAESWAPLPEALSLRCHEASCPPSLSRRAR